MGDLGSKFWYAHAIHMKLKKHGHPPRLDEALKYYLWVAKGRHKYAIAMLKKNQELQDHIKHILEHPDPSVDQIEIKRILLSL